MERFSNFYGVTPPGLLALLGGLLLVLFTARALLTLLTPRPWPRHPALLLCAYWIAGGAIIHLSVLLAGKTGQLELEGILLYQAAFLAALLLALRRRHSPLHLARLLAQDAVSLVRYLPALLWPPRWRWRKAPVKTLALIAVALLAVLGAVALLTPVVNHDTNLYRLPRIGQWLQQNHIGHFDSPKWEMNFTGRHTEYLVLWLISFFKRGFPLIQGFNWLGGLVTLAACYELARRARFTPLLRWAALLVLLGMPNVLAQFTTTQTDLIAASYATAGLVLLHRALSHGVRAWRWPEFLLVGIAFGLAIGTKQTVLVWGPGYAVLALFWLARRRGGFPLAAWLRQLWKPVLAAALAVLPFCLPLFWENHAYYGNWLVPARFQKIYPSLQPSERVRPLYYPAILAYQHTQPGAQPPLLRPLLQPLNAASLELARVHTLIGNGEGGLPKCAADLARWLPPGRFLEDLLPPSLIVTSALLLAPLLLLGAALSRRRRSRPPAATSAAALALAALAFLACSAYFGWEIYSLRFWVIPGPILVLGALGLPLLFTSPGSAWGRKILAAWVLLLLALHLPLTLRGMWLHSNNGLLTLREPMQMQNYAHAAEMQALARDLDRRQRNIHTDIAGFWPSIFFRGPKNHYVTFLRPEQMPELAQVLQGERDVAITSLEKAAASGNYVVRELAPISWVHTVAARLPRQGEPATPLAKWVSGYFPDGWIAPEAQLRVLRAPDGALYLNFRNLHPDPLELEITGGETPQILTIPPHELTLHKIPARDGQMLHFRTSRTFHPGPNDPRELGVPVKFKRPPGSRTF